MASPQQPQQPQQPVFYPQQQFATYIPQRQPVLMPQQRFSFPQQQPIVQNVQPAQQQPQQPAPAVVYHQANLSSVSAVDNQNLLGTRNQQNQWIEPKQSDYDPIVPLILSLLLPGLGHVIIGQTNKGMFYMISSILLAFFSSMIPFIGICLLPILIVEAIVVIVDAFQMAKRLKEGFPIMQGECSMNLATYGLGLVMNGPFFVTNDPQAPMEWKMKMSQRQEQEQA